MKTTLQTGEPAPVAELLDGFALRMVALAEMAWLVAINQESPAVNTLELAISRLREDWDCFETATRDRFQEVAL